MKKYTGVSKISAVVCMILMLCLSTGCSSEKPEKEIQQETTQATTVPEETTEAATEVITEVKTEAETEAFDLSGISTFELSSEDLLDGVWNTDITKTANGSNRSPQLSWDPVEGAQSYVIYMIDTSAKNWLHWKSVSNNETVLPKGWASEKEYVGPYPPNGTHDYEIYVFALKEPVDEVKGNFDYSNARIFERFGALDKDGGNIISYGHIKGTYTKGD